MNSVIEKVVLSLSKKLNLSQSYIISKKRIYLSIPPFSLVSVIFKKSGEDLMAMFTQPSMIKRNFKSQLKW